MGVRYARSPNLRGLAAGIADYSIASPILCRRPTRRTFSHPQRVVLIPPRRSRSEALSLSIEQIETRTKHEDRTRARI